MLQFCMVYSVLYVLWFQVKIKTIVNIHAWDLNLCSSAQLVHCFSLLIWSFYNIVIFFYQNRIKWKKYLLRLLRQILFWMLHFYINYVIYFFYFMFRSILLILDLPWNRYMLPTQIQGKFLCFFFLNCRTCSCLVIQVWIEWINFWQ